jgi:hypothetical protein
MDRPAPFGLASTELRGETNAAVSIQRGHLRPTLFSAATRVFFGVLLDSGRFGETRKMVLRRAASNEETKRLGLNDESMKPWF